MSLPPPGPPPGPPQGPPEPPPYGPYEPYPQPYPAPPPYPGYQPYPVKPPTSAWAVVSLVFGILGGVLVSVVSGIVALNKTKNGQAAGRGLAIAGLVLSALWTLGIIAVVILVAVTDDDSVTPTSLGVGDCLTEIPDSYRVLSIDTVDCSQPHVGEVFANITIPGDTFPGESAMESYQEQCSPALAEFSPDAMADESIGLYLLYPTPDTWKAGDRTVTCIATSDTPLTGSLGG